VVADDRKNREQLGEIDELQARAESKRPTPGGGR